MWPGLHNLQIHGSPGRVLATLIAVLVGGTMLFYCVLFIGGSARRGLPTLLSILASAVLCPFEWNSFGAIVSPVDDRPSCREVDPCRPRSVFGRVNEAYANRIQTANGRLYTDGHIA